MNWEDEAKQAASDSLQKDFNLYEFHVTYINGSPKIQIYIDKLSDPYGSPTVNDCEKFTKIFDLKLTNLMEEHKLAANYFLEVSSPGAERKIQIPNDLERFESHPMKVRYKQEGKPLQHILKLQNYDEKLTTWNIADVKKNRKDGNYKKANRNKNIEIFIKDIDEACLHLDF